jgi:hypothetical protein
MSIMDESERHANLEQSLRDLYRHRAAVADARPIVAPASQSRRFPPAIRWAVPVGVAAIVVVAVALLAFPSNPTTPSDVQTSGNHGATAPPGTAAPLSSTAFRFRHVIEGDSPDCRATYEFTGSIDYSAKRFDVTLAGHDGPDLVVRGDDLFINTRNIRPGTELSSKDEWQRASLREAALLDEAFPAWFASLREGVPLGASLGETTSLNDVGDTFRTTMKRSPESTVNEEVLVHDGSGTFEVRLIHDSAGRIVEVKATTTILDGQSVVTTRIEAGPPNDTSSIGNPSTTPVIDVIATPPPDLLCRSI